VRRRAVRFVAAVACGFAALTIAAPPAAADSIRDRQWHLKYLNIAAAQAVSQGDGVVVGLVDSGVNANHPDLVGNILPGVDVSGGGAPNGLEDLVGHGTSMAGLIAGHGHGNGDGVLGIAPHAKIFPIRTTRSESSTPDSVATGIDAALRNGAKVISVSQGGSATLHLQEAVKSALAADAVVVAAIGNKSEELLSAFPASYEGVVAVGAVDQDGNAASVGVTGSSMVLSAPGMRIVSTSQTGAYQIADGTSDSAAIVAGVVALVRSKYPNLKAPEVIHRLTATATDKGPPGRDPEYGFGIVNPVAALTADVPPLTPSANPTPTSVATAAASTGKPQAAPPADDNSGSSAPIIIVVVIVVAAAGAVAWFVVRRRRATVP
jgi:type VII secretion-associated serine protease mycosin